MDRDEGSELKDELAVLGAHVQKFIEELRPWAEFVGPVSAPRWTQLDVKKRVATNLSFFTTNYLMICAICSAFYILRSPGLLVTLLLSLCMFMYVFMSRRKVLVVMDVTLGTREKTIAAALGTLLLLSMTGYIFSLQWSGAVGCSLCLLHATFRPPVARAVRGATSRGLDGTGSNPELHGGDSDLEGGGAGSGGNGRGRVNANMRLRTRPTAGGMTGGGGMAPVGMGGGTFRDIRSSVPMVDPKAATRGRPHAHGS